MRRTAQIPSIYWRWRRWFVLILQRHCQCHAMTVFTKILHVASQSEHATREPRTSVTVISRWIYLLIKSSHKNCKPNLITSRYINFVSAQFGQKLPAPWRGWNASKDVCIHLQQLAPDWVRLRKKIIVLRPVAKMTFEFVNSRLVVAAASSTWSTVLQRAAVIFPCSPLS